MLRILVSIAKRVYEHYHLASFASRRDSEGMEKQPVNVPSCIHSEVSVT